MTVSTILMMDRRTPSHEKEDVYEGRNSNDVLNSLDLLSRALIGQATAAPSILDNARQFHRPQPGSIPMIEAVPPQRPKMVPLHSLQRQRACLSQQLNPMTLPSLFSDYGSQQQTKTSVEDICKDVTEIPLSHETHQSEGCVIVPCRARGMPKDHNAKTAYFAIPRNIAHGEGLRCSHPGCREKGIRFRFCSVCSIPVAKRNFSTRHHHGDLLEMSIRQKNGLEKSEADNELAQRRERAQKARSKSSASSSTDSASSSSSDSEQSVKAKKRRNRDEERLNRKKPRLESESEEELETSRQFFVQWHELLSRRPSNKEPDELSEWLKKVMELSDEVATSDLRRQHVERMFENDLVSTGDGFDHSDSCSTDDEIDSL